MSIKTKIDGDIIQIHSISSRIMETVLKTGERENENISILNTYATDMRYSEEHNAYWGSAENRIRQENKRNIHTLLVDNNAHVSTIGGNRDFAGK